MPVSSTGVTNGAGNGKKFVVAVLDPLTAAKSVQPSTLVCSSPPGRKRAKGANPVNSRCEISVRKMISPIHRNIGTAASSHEIALDEMTPAAIEPMRSSENPRVSQSELMPTRIRPEKIQTPVPRKRATRASRTIPDVADPMAVT